MELPGRPSRPRWGPGPGVTVLSHTFVPVFVFVFVVVFVFNLTKDLLWSWREGLVAVGPGGDRESMYSLTPSSVHSLLH